MGRNDGCVTVLRLREAVTYTIPPSQESAMVSIQKSYLGMFSEATDLKDNLTLSLVLLIS